MWLYIDNQTVYELLSIPCESLGQCVKLNKYRIGLDSFKLDFKGQVVR